MGIKMDVKNVLILVSDDIKRLNDFKKFDVTLGTFSDINFNSVNLKLKFKSKDITSFDTIYLRYVGKGHEVATLIAVYAKENGIRVIDAMYEDSHLLGPSMAKSIELRTLIKAGIPVPKTVFNNFKSLKFPYVIKSTTGHNSTDIWRVNSAAQLENVKKTFDSTKNYFAQEIIPNAFRIRVLVVGKRAIGTIVRPTKWGGSRMPRLNPVPGSAIKIALRAARAVKLEICGVDVLTNESGKYWVIETNADPAWKSVRKECKINVEEEIVKYLKK